MPLPSKQRSAMCGLASARIFATISAGDSDRDFATNSPHWSPMRYWTVTRFSIVSFQPCESFAVKRALVPQRVNGVAVKVPAAQLWPHPETLHAKLNASIHEYANGFNGPVAVVVIERY